MDPHAALEFPGDAGAYTLTMRVDASALEVLATTGTASDDHSVYRRIPLTGALPLTRALEEAVYDNPVLLSDFVRVKVLVYSPVYTLLPTALVQADPAMALKGAMAMSPQSDLPEVAVEAELEGTPATAVTLIGEDLKAFLERTFFNVAIVPHVAPLASWFVKGARSTDGPRLYASLRHRSLDVVLLGAGGTLQLVNTFEYTDPADAIYYIMAASSAAGADNTCEIILGGSPEVRAALTPELRRHAPCVMPVIMPAATMRGGMKSAAASLDLTVASL